MPWAGRASTNAAKAALLCGATSVAVLLAIAAKVTDRMDAEVAGRLASFHLSAQRRAASELVQLGNLHNALVLCCGLLLLGAATRPPARVALAAAVLAGSSVTSELLSSHFDRSLVMGHGYELFTVHGSAPSGHTIVVVSIAGAALLLAPTAWREVTAGASAAAIATMGYAVMIRDSHVLSDVLAGVAIAATWSLAAAAALPSTERLVPDRLGPLPFRRSWLRLTLASTIALAVGAFLLSGRRGGVEVVRDLSTVVVPAVVVAAFGVAMALATRVATQRGR